MAIIQSKYAQGILTPAYPGCAGIPVGARFAFTLAANLAAGDIIELAPLYNGVRIVDMILDADDFDSGTAAIIDVGIMSGVWQDTNQARTCGAEFFSGVNLLQTGGVLRPTLKTAFRTSPSGMDRSIGIKMTTPAQTFVAGTLGLTVLYATD